MTDKGKRKCSDGVILSESEGVLQVFHLLVQDMSDVAGRLARLENEITHLREEIQQLLQLSGDISIEDADRLDEE